MIGFNEAGSWGAQGGACSRALNQVPFINATAGLHDYVFNTDLLQQTSFNNIWTMPASALVAIPAALNNPNISWLTQIQKPSSVTWAAQTKPATVESVVRIKSNTTTQNVSLIEVLK